MARRHRSFGRGYVRPLAVTYNEAPIPDPENPTMPTPLTFSYAPPAVGVIGEEYVATAIIVGGTEPYSAMLQSGVLPPGVFLNPVTASLSGTITAGGAFAGVIRVQDSAGATPVTIPFSITVAEEVIPPEDPWVTVHRDRSDKMLMFRTTSNNVDVVINGISWGWAAHAALESNNSVGNVVGHLWEDGNATAHPHLVGTRRDDQTYVYNMVSDAIRNLGHAPVVRDLANQRTRMRVMRKASIPNAGQFPAMHNTDRPRIDGTLVGSTLNYRNTFRVKPPFRFTITDVDFPEGVLEAWIAAWFIQADSHQDTVHAEYPDSVKVEVTPGTHVEFDALELTGRADNVTIDGVSTLIAQTLRANLLYTKTTDNSFANADIDNFGYINVGSNVQTNLFDLQMEATETECIWSWRLASNDVSWTEYARVSYPSNSRFATTPVSLQIDGKAGFGSEDRPAWVKSIDGSTPEFEWSYHEIHTETRSSNLVNCYISLTAIDPDDIPTVSIVWNVLPANWDNAAAAGTTLFTVTGIPGWTPQVKGLSGLAFDGYACKVTGIMPPGTREIVIWYIPPSGGKGLVGVQEVTVADNAVWWDATATLDINKESMQVRELGVAGTWSTYYEADGTPKAALLNKMMGTATSGIVVFRGENGPASFAGFYGYTEATNYGRYAAKWHGDTLQIGIKDGAGADHFTSANITSATDEFNAGFAWDAADIKFCCNGGPVGSSTAQYLAGDGVSRFMEKDGFAANPFTGTMKRISFYPNTTMISNGALQALTS